MSRQSSRQSIRPARYTVASFSGRRNAVEGVQIALAKKSSLELSDLRRIRQLVCSYDPTHVKAALELMAVLSQVEMEDTYSSINKHRQRIHVPSYLHFHRYNAPSAPRPALESRTWRHPVEVAEDDDNTIWVDEEETDESESDSEVVDLVSEDDNVVDMTNFDPAAFADSSDEEGGETEVDSESEI